MIETNVIETTTVEDYAIEINSYAVKTAEIIVKIGDTFNRAKAELKHGEFSKLFELTPFGQRTAQNYMRIASSEKVQALLKNESDSHLGVKKLLEVATGKDTKESKKKDLKWWERKAIYDEMPNMPFVDFYKEDIETDIMQKALITYDMWALLNISMDELTSIIEAKAEEEPSILSGGYVPFVFSNETLGKTNMPLISIFGLKNGDSLVNHLLRDKDDYSGLGGSGYYINKFNVKLAVHTDIMKTGAGYGLNDFTFGLDWMKAEGLLAR